MTLASVIVAPIIILFFVGLYLTVYNIVYSLF